MEYFEYSTEIAYKNQFKLIEFGKKQVKANKIVILFVVKRDENFNFFVAKIK